MRSVRCFFIHEPLGAPALCSAPPPWSASEAQTWPRKVAALRCERIGDGSASGVFDRPPGPSGPHPFLRGRMETSSFSRSHPNACGAVMVPELDTAPVSAEVLPIHHHAHLQGLPGPASLVPTLLTVSPLERSASPPPLSGPCPFLLFPSPSGGLLASLPLRAPSLPSSFLPPSSPHSLRAHSQAGPDSFCPG